MKFTQIPETVFQELVLNAGVLMSDFNPATSELNNTDIIGATTGGISSDKEIMDAVGKAVDKNTITQVGIMLLGAQKITAVIPLLLKTHRHDIYAILSIVGEKSVEDVAAQNIMATMWQMKELLNDKELVSFFKSWAHGVESE